MSADIWSCPSFTELRRDGLACERWNLLHPTDAPRAVLCGEMPGGPRRSGGRRHRLHQDLRRQIRPFIPGGRHYRVLGTDGFGRSDTREKLREFFEVDRHWVALAALKALADEGEIKASVVAAAIKKYGIDPNKPNPASV